MLPFASTFSQSVSTATVRGLSADGQCPGTGKQTQQIRYFRCVTHFKFTSWSKQHTHSQVRRKKTTAHSEKKNNFTHLAYVSSNPVRTTQVPASRLPAGQPSRKSRIRSRTLCLRPMCWNPNYTWIQWAKKVQSEMVFRKKQQAHYNKKKSKRAYRTEVNFVHKIQYWGCICVLVLSEFTSSPS